MAEDTGIEWCDATFNPWWGCEKVSPACAHCYAERDSKRYGFSIWGRGHAFRFLSEGNWAKPLRWARLAREGKLPNRKLNRDGHRPRVFTASMADVFEERAELEAPRRRLFELIAETPELDWLVLTKRPEFARIWLTGNYASYAVGDFFPNVWLGVSIENARFTWRADVLRATPAAMRFLSCEPLLGSLFETKQGSFAGQATSRAPAITVAEQRTGKATGQGRGVLARERNASAPPPRQPLDLTGIDWLIAGGESGPRHRETKVEWARELRDACADRDVAFFWKQNGGLYGKQAGKSLDGREWCEFPEPRVPVAA